MLLTQRFAHPFWLVGLAVVGCHVGSADWPDYQHDRLRTASQLNKSSLSDPSQARNLRIVWRWSPLWHTGDATHPPDPNVNGPDGVGFSASPAVYNGVIYVGHLNGHMYAIRDDSDHGTMLWKYPPTGLPALVAATHPSTGYNPSFPGIASSAAVVESV